MSVVVRKFWSSQSHVEPYVPDNMEMAQTMRFQVMSTLTACLAVSDFRNISGSQTMGAKGKSNDKDHHGDGKFQCHMEGGLFHAPMADVLDIGDLIVKWGSLLLDRKCNELLSIPYNE